MKKTNYVIAELAMAYFQSSNARNAQRCFKRRLKSERDLWEKLKNLHFHAYQRTFTPKQYEAVIEVFGEPDDGLGLL